MRKLLVTFVLAIVTMTAAFADGDRYFGRPRAQTSGVGGSSVGGSLDNSLFKFTYNFDGLEHGTMGFLYDIAEADGFVNRPIRMSVAGARGSDGVDLWVGLGFSYDFIKTSDFTFGGAMSFPGFFLSGNDLSFNKMVGRDVVPSVYMSIPVG